MLRVVDWTTFDQSCGRIFAFWKCWSRRSYSGRGDGPDHATRFLLL